MPRPDFSKLDAPKAEPPVAGSSGTDTEDYELTEEDLNPFPPSSWAQPGSQPKVSVAEQLRQRREEFNARRDAFYDGIIAPEARRLIAAGGDLEDISPDIRKQLVDLRIELAKLEEDEERYRQIKEADFHSKRQPATTEGGSEANSGRRLAQSTETEQDPKDGQSIRSQKQQRGRRALWPFRKG